MKARWLRVSVLVTCIAALLAVLAYLRDPPWLANVSSGLTAWETDAAGIRYRWTRGHASFFVPTDAGAITLTLRSVKDTPADWPITVTTTIDDRPVHTLSFTDETWRDVTLQLPERGKRKFRRIDLKLDRLRARQRGVQLRDVRIGS